MAISLQFSDNFDRGDGSLGANWIGHTNMPVISGNRAAATNPPTTANACAAPVLGAGKTDQMAVAVLTSSRSGGNYANAALAVRISDPTIALPYMVYLTLAGDDSRIQVSRYSGSWFALGAHWASHNNQQISLRALGTSYTALTAGVPCIEATDAALASGHPGVMIENRDPGVWAYWDNFEGWWEAGVGSSVFGPMNTLGRRAIA